MIARRAVVVACVAMAGACTTVGPDYRRPAESIPVAFKEQGPWREARPADDSTRGDWWRMFGDATLDDLEQRGLASNPGLLAMAARVDQARAAAGFARAEQLPNVTLDARAGRERFSGNRPDQPGKVVFEYEARRYLVPATMSYEVGLWGRMRRANQAAAARLEASQAAWHVARLALAADIANTYFALRTLEAEERLLRDAIDLRQRTAGLVAARKRGGLASDLDLARTATELAAAEAEVAVVLRPDWSTRSRSWSAPRRRTSF